MALALSLTVVACGERATLGVSEGSGPDPKLPEPVSSLIPTVNVARATGWPTGAAPIPAPGLAVKAFARGLEHPRWVYVLPNGDVLVAETNAPADVKPPGGIKGRAMKLMKRRAGAAVPSPDRITLLRDADRDGEAEQRSVLLSNLHSPFGMALVGDTLFVANTDAVLAFPYRSGDLEIASPGQVLVELPGGPINHHWTKNLIASPDGRSLYVAVGSNSNVAERGLEAEEGRAAIWQVDLATATKELFGSGLRNPVGMAWEASGERLWVVVNERDELSSDLVPDYLTGVEKGDFFGWPWSYYGDRVDLRVEPRQPEKVAAAKRPDYALGPHTASLGLASAEGSRLPAPFTAGMFVGQHGSWNRRPHSGYKVVFVRFEGGQPTGIPLDVLSGFLSEDDAAYGRPVGVAIDSDGGLLVADDVGNLIWRVTGVDPPPVAEPPASTQPSRLTRDDPGDAQGSPAAQTQPASRLDTTLD